MKNNLKIIQSIIRDSIDKNITIIDQNQRFIEDLGFDELDFIVFLVALEDEMNIFIPDSKATTLKTVGDVLNYLEEINY